jgi:hypothetical protein
MKTVSKKKFFRLSYSDREFLKMMAVPLAFTAWLLVLTVYGLAHMKVDSNTVSSTSTLQHGVTYVPVVKSKGNVVFHPVFH